MVPTPSRYPSLSNGTWRERTYLKPTNQQLKRMQHAHQQDVTCSISACALKSNPAQSHLRAPLNVGKLETHLHHELRIICSGRRSSTWQACWKNNTHELSTFGNKEKSNASIRRRLPRASYTYHKNDYSPVVCRVSYNPMQSIGLSTNCSRG